MKKKISINKLTNPLVEFLIEEKDRLSIEVINGPQNCRIIDAGINISGCVEAGLIISKICLGGLGIVNINPNDNINLSSHYVNVHASEPILSCLGSQYAGWSLSSKDFFSLGSGPVRSIAQKEKIFEEIAYKDKSKKTSVILEVDKYPPEEIVKKIANDCKLDCKDITFILTPTTSICGNIQVIARVLEVAIHKIHEIKFPLNKIVHGLGLHHYLQLQRIL